MRLNIFPFQRCNNWTSWINCDGN